MPDVKFSNQYPYTDFHELNLDWVIKEVKYWSEKVGKTIQSISLTGTVGLVDTYTINYSDGTTSTFDVTNGNGITSVAKTGTVGLVDTYTITFQDGSTTTFEVHNGTASIDPTLTLSGYAADAKVTGDELANKYTRYSVDYIPDITLDMFKICPTYYSLTTYSGTPAITHSNILPNTYIWSLFKSDYYDIKFKLHYGAFATTPAVGITLAANSTFSIALFLNATTGNVGQFSSSTRTNLTGITRNTSCRNIAADDTVHMVKDGTKLAIYLVDGGVDVPVFSDEWVDIIDAYSSTGITADDIGFGLTSNNSARNEILLYDFYFIQETGDHFMAYNEADARLTALEQGNVAPGTVDLIMFMGQSNMAGRGNSALAPGVIDGAGYEYRAITDPTKLYPITEPFGINENDPSGINDILGGLPAKSGDMIPAFVNNYFIRTRCPVVGVSASEGGTRISLWQPGTARYNDAKSRYTSAINFLESNNYTVRHKFIIWCQGESDGDAGMSTADYETDFNTMAAAWLADGIDTIFVIKIGNYNGTGTQDYNDIMTAQNNVCQTVQNVVMASTDFAGMKDRNLMKDDWHYKQDGYNEIGEYSGINISMYVKTGKEPTMYDTQNDTLYYSHKN